MNSWLIQNFYTTYVNIEQYLGALNDMLPFLYTHNKIIFLKKTNKLM